MNSSICIFTHHYHPQLSGIGNFVDGLAHALVARGDKVVIVTNDSMGVGAGRLVESDLEIIQRIIAENQIERHAGQNKAVNAPCPPDRLKQATGRLHGENHSFL